MIHITISVGSSQYSHIVCYLKRVTRNIVPQLQRVKDTVHCLEMGMNEGSGNHGFVHLEWDIHGIFHGSLD